MLSFRELINSGQPVLVDFYAEWCGPCKMLAPVIKEVAAEVSGKAKVIKIDIDKNPAVASAYGIQAVPTLMIFKNGEVKWRQPGVVPKHQIVDAVSRFA